MYYSNNIELRSILTRLPTKDNMLSLPYLLISVKKKIIVNTIVNLKIDLNQANTQHVTFHEL